MRTGVGRDAGGIEEIGEARICEAERERGAGVDRESAEGSRLHDRVPSRRTFQRNETGRREQGVEFLAASTHRSGCYARCRAANAGANRKILMPSKANRKSKKPSQSVRLALPATSANLGPAFDAAALAMDFYIKIKAQAAERFSIVAAGRDEEICGNLENHLILTTYREVLKASGREITPLALQIDNDIPIGKGCGSSAAARLVGI